MPQNAPNLPTKASLRATVRRWDPKLSEDSPAFDAALVMLAALYLGSKNLARLGRSTGIPYHRVTAFAARLRDAGIWADEGKTAAGWDAPGRKGQAAFWIDVNVAVGLFRAEGCLL